MCLICDHKGQLEAIGKEIGEKLAATTAPGEVIEMAAKKAAAHLIDAIMKTVAMYDVRRVMVNPVAQMAMAKVYGPERMEEINELLRNIESMPPSEIARRVDELRDEIVVDAEIVKGFLPGNEDDSDLN